MSIGILDTLILATAFGSGLVGGVFFAFSSFVMTALARLPAAQGIAAMQSINRVAINPLFMGVLFGTAAACAALATVSVAGWTDSRAVYLMAGSGLYIVGVILVTVVFNVPRNEALAAVDPNTAESSKLWERYVVEWTTWNHVRTVASLTSASLLMVAFINKLSPD